MKSKVTLLIQMVMKGFLGFLLLGLFLFGCAGTVQYPNAWLLILSLFALMMAMGITLLVKYPETLQRRLKARESEKAQKGYVIIIGILFLASFALAGLDFRFHWSEMPFVLSLIALGVMVVGYGLYVAVILQNSYASRVVEVAKDQALVSTGLYALVRHPMYFACLLVFLPMPLILGSWFALLPMLVFPAFLALRSKNEEAVLLKGLEGYAEYTQKTKYRLIPYIW